MGGRSSAAAPTRYAGIQVQTSALGLQMPVGWGTFRCKCNLIDYLDFKSKAQKASTGKGGSTTTGYSYSATIVLGLCEGPIADITKVWVNSKQYVGGAGVALGKAGLSVATGAVGQGAWSYLTSNHPAHAIGYSGLAICHAANYALDSGAGTPNHAFEVVSNTRLSGLNLPDASPKDILTDFFTNPRYGLPGWSAGLLDATSMATWESYCLAANLVLSPVLDQARTGTDFLKEVFLATNSTCVWSEGRLKFVPYGDTVISGNGVTFTPNLTPVYALDDDSFIPQSDGDDPLMVDILDQSDAYNIVQIEYLDRANQYNTAIATAQDMANIEQFGRRKQDPTTLHSICVAAVAQACAQLYLQRTLYIRGQYRFVLPWSYALLEPGDIVELTDAALGLNAYPVRITQIDDDEEVCRSVIAEDLLAGVGHAPLYANQDGAGFQTNRAIDPGGVEANLLIWSEDLTNGAWNKIAATITANATTDPLFGATTADKVIPTPVNAQHFISQAAPAFDGVAYTYAVYVKPAGRKCVSLQISDFVSSFGWVNFDANAGTVLSEGVVGAALAESSTIVSAGGGWYRISITVTLPTYATADAVVLVLDDLGNETWTGNGVDGLYIWGAQMKQGVDVPVYAYTGASALGPFLFNPPASLASGPQSEVCAAVAGGANWGGCHVWTSLDGTNYQMVGTIDQPARFGFSRASFASHVDPDTTNTLSVDLGPSAGALTGGSSTDADGSATLCLIDNELIAYQTATLTAQYRYDLGAYVRRGAMGTAIASHAAGAPFVRMDDAVFSFPYIATQANKQVYVKFQSFNPWGEATQDLSVCNAYLITLNPVGAAANITGGGNRICFSEFEHGPADGWVSNTSSPAVSTALFTLGGIVNRVISATATAAGQSINQVSLQFPVTAGETLAVMGKLGVSANAVGYLYLVFYDATNTFITQVIAVGGITPGAANTQFQGFVQAPVGAITAAYVAQVDSLASGFFQIELSQAEAIGASPAQTTFPTFSKGPAAEYGGDVTGNWTAAAILGQGAFATLSDADWATQVTGIGKPADYANVALVYRQQTAPTSPTVNDIWVKTDSSGVPLSIYAWNGSSWVLGADITGNNTAAAILGQAPAATDTTIQPGSTQNLIFDQATDPYGGGTVPPGAFWFDTTNGLPYVSSGGGWTLFTPSVTSGTVVKTVTGLSSGGSVTGSYTIPPAFTPYLLVSLKGASGGSSWAGSNANLPGGGGSCGSKIAVSAGDVISWSLGQRGTNGTSGSHNGQNGTGSTASGPSLTLTAGAGGGAPDTPSGATGAGGTASGGNIANNTGSGNSSNLANVTLTAST